MSNQESHPTLAALTRRVEDGADAVHIAEAMVSIWQEIDASLRPIIGQQGMAALFQRSLYLTAQIHPWMGVVPTGVIKTMELMTLRAAFAQQSSVDAAIGGEALFQTFFELLTSLVGPSLTERLLSSVWANSLSGPSAQDTSP